MKKLIIATALVISFTVGTVFANTGLGSDKFDDIPTGHWADRAIGWAVENNIVNGVSDTKFGPNEPLTRAQMVTILHRYHRLGEPPSHFIITDRIFKQGGVEHLSVIIDIENCEFPQMKLILMQDGVPITWNETLYKRAGTESRYSINIPIPDWWTHEHGYTLEFDKAHC